jgi:hypothetical protein
MHGNEMVEGHPIKVYDDGGRSIDRYTVVFMDQHEHSFICGRSFACLAMNGAPFHPQGFCQHSQTRIGSHLGKRIAFAALPDDCQKAVRQEWK